MDQRAIKSQATVGPEPSTINEVTSLLNRSIEEVQKKHNNEENDDTPLPSRQIALLCYCRMVEPVAYFSIFPYINQMIRETGIEEADVGFYSGWVVCTSIILGYNRKWLNRPRIGVLVFTYSNVSHDCMGQSGR